MAHDFMKYIHVLMGILFCLLVQQNIHAQTLYTWQDAAGTIHISKQKPPAGQPLTDRTRYAARISTQPEIETPSPDGVEADAVLSAARQAKLTREQAQHARRMAEDAIEEAHRVKKETDAFLEPWRDRKRVSSNVLLQIESRIQKTNQAIAKAEHLIESAKQAEQEAQAAENEARRIQKQFVEAYTEIITN
jgi:hypothetical protein